MKKKNLNQLQLKKKTVANFKGGIMDDQPTDIFPTGNTCMSVDFCASEQTCVTINTICRTQFLCGSQLTECYCTI